MTRCDLTVCGLLLLVSGLVFSQSAGHEFLNYDDDRLICGNPHVAHGLTLDGLVGAFSSPALSNWVPLCGISWMVDRQLFGDHAGGYHLTNVLLHAATVVLLFLTLRKMTGRCWPSALAAALFAIHPLRAESVAWLSERKDVLSGLFFVLTLAAYVGYVRRPFSLVRYLLVVDCLGLGLLAKQTMITLPLVLLLLDYWPLGRLRCLPFPRRVLWEKVPMLGLAFAFGLLTIHAQDAATLLANRHYSFLWRIGNGIISYAAYLGQFFCPFGLTPCYPRRAVLPAWQVAAAALVLVSITAVAIRWRRRRPYLLVGWLWYVGMLVPVIGLLQFGAQAEADRFTYLPQIGLAIAVAWAAADACRRPAARWCGCAAAASAVALLATAGWRQVSFWRDSETLFSYAVAGEPRNLTVRHQLALALFDSGRDEEAAVQFRIGHKIDPAYIADRLPVLSPVTLIRDRQRAEIAKYAETLRRQPDSIDVRSKLAWRLATSPVQSLRNADEAIRIARRAEELGGGGRTDVLDALAAGYAEAGNFVDATVAARKALGLAVRQNLPRLAAEIGARCRLYEDHKPFHEPLSL